LSASPVAEDTYVSGFGGLSRAAWIKIGLITVLMAMAFWPNLRRLWLKTNPFYGEPNWGHAVIVPIVGLYYLYTNREQLLKARIQTSWWGLLPFLGGMLFYAYGIYPGQNDYFKDVGMVVTLFGVVQLLCGWEVMKIAWFPIAFLICALPWPGQFYSILATPLQRLAAIVAVKVMAFTGVPAGNAGTKIFIGGITGDVRTLNVAEACAGLRSLMTFVSLAAALAFLSVRPLWQKILITLSAIPIAVACNVMRVSGQGLLDHYVSTAWSEGFAHQVAGLVMLLPAFLLVLLVFWLLDHIFVEEAGNKAELAKISGPAANLSPRSASNLVIELPRRTAPAATMSDNTPTKPAAARPVVAPPRPNIVKPQPPRREKP
jgi:exosortase